MYVRARSRIRTFLSPFVVALAFLVSFTATAHAATVITPPDGTLWDLLQPVLDAFQHGSYVYAGSLALVVAVAIIRRYAAPKQPWFSTDAGAGLLTLLASFGATLAATLPGGIAFEWVMAWHALEIAFGAAGGYTLVKHLIISPYIRHLSAKGPDWLHVPMSWILWIFQEDGKPKTPSQLAEAAVAAVNAPQNDVTVSVITPQGSAVASSPAVPPPAPISVEVSIVPSYLPPLPRTPSADNITFPRTTTPIKPE